MMSQQAISRPLITPTSVRSGRKLKPEPYASRHIASIRKGSRPRKRRANRSSIIEAITCGPKVAAYTSPTPSIPQAVLSFRNTKYRPPNPGGGLPTTNTLTLSSFMKSVSQNEIRGLLGHHDGGRVGVRRGHGREHRCIDHSERRDAVRAQLRVDD